MKLFTNFLNDESGAVTVDWVVLTAAIVGLGIAVMAAVDRGASDVANRIETELKATDVGTTAGTGAAT